jgi:hypothetical protein
MWKLWKPDGNTNCLNDLRSREMETEVETKRKPTFLKAMALY